MAIEQPRYKIVLKEGAFEIREYEPYIVAEVTVDGKFGEAGNEAFGMLGGYIFGGNQGRSSISMTSPVAQQQEAKSEKISMTAPVAQQKKGESWRVSFMMPSKYSLENLPVPDDPSVHFSEVPGRIMAVIVFSGSWSESRIARKTEQLKIFMAGRNLKPAGNPVVARYNPPFVPPLFRRNEVQIELESLK